MTPLPITTLVWGTPSHPSGFSLDFAFGQPPFTPAPDSHTKVLCEEEEIDSFRHGKFHDWAPTAKDRLTRENHTHLFNFYVTWESSEIETQRNMETCMFLWTVMRPACLWTVWLEDQKKVWSNGNELGEIGKACLSRFFLAPLCHQTWGYPFSLGRGRNPMEQGSYDLFWGKFS